MRCTQYTWRIFGHMVVSFFWDAEKNGCVHLFWFDCLDISFESNEKIDDWPQERKTEG